MKLVSIKILKRRRIIVSSSEMIYSISEEVSVRVLQEDVVLPVTGYLYREHRSSIFKDILGWIMGDPNRFLEVKYSIRVDTPYLEDPDTVSGGLGINTRLELVETRIKNKLRKKIIQLRRDVKDRYILVNNVATLEELSKKEGYGENTLKFPGGVLIREDWYLNKI